MDYLYFCVGLAISPFVVYHYYVYGRAAYEFDRIGFCFLLGLLSVTCWPFSVPFYLAVMLGRAKRESLR